MALSRSQFGKGLDQRNFAILLYLRWLDTRALCSTGRAIHLESRNDVDGLLGHWHKNHCPVPRRPNGYDRFTSRRRCRRIRKNRHNQPLKGKFQGFLSFRLQLRTCCGQAHAKYSLVCELSLQFSKLIYSSSEPDSKKSPILSRIPRPSSHENIYTVPNILTFSRLIAAPLVGYFLVYDHHAAALGLFAYAGITDLVDGYIARRYNLQTVVGTIIDPMADKLLMTIGVACLAVNGSIPGTFCPSIITRAITYWVPLVWLAVIILGRDIGLALSAIYYRWISLPPPKTMARYWDFSLPSAEVKPTAISKVNTFLQLLLVGSAIAIPVVPEAFLDAWHLREAMTAFQ